MLRDALVQQGANVLCCSMLEIETLPPPPALDDLLSKAVPDWLVFTSSNGVRAFAQRAEALAIDLSQHLDQSQIACVGPRTAEAVQALQLKVACVPETHTAEALADLLTQQSLHQRQIALLQGEQAQPLLAKRLSAAGANVSQVIVYRSRPTEELGKINQILRQQHVHWLTFLNGLAVQHFEAALSPDSRAKIRQSKIACIGPVTAQQARKSLGRCELIASPHTVAGLVNSLCQEAA